MFFKKILLLILLCLIPVFQVFSQSEDDSTGSWGKRWKHHWKDNYDFVHIVINGKPTISLLYGFSKINLKNSAEKFDDANLAELKIGYTTERSKTDADNIISYRYRYLVLSKVSSYLFKAPPDNNNYYSQGFATSMWRAGLMKSSGYGYKFGQTALILYNSSGFLWSRVDVKPVPTFVSFTGNPPNNQHAYDRFNEAVRFGTSGEGGARFELSKLVTLDAGYERSIIFPRHLFWKWAGSFIIESAAQSLVDGFVDEVFGSSPQLAPVVSFVLKNALSYGIYELRQDKMNWPFDSEAPLSYDQVKIGLTFVF